MLKWTSRSTLGSDDGIYASANRDASPSREVQVRHGGHFEGGYEYSVPEAAKRLKLAIPDTAGISRAGNLPFSYTDPASIHRVGHPYLKRLESQNVQENVARSNTTDRSERLKTVSPPNSPMVKPGWSSNEVYARSKSMPRLGSPLSSTSSFSAPKKGIMSKVKKLFRRSRGDIKERRSVSQPSSPKVAGRSGEKDKPEQISPKTQKSRFSHPSVPSTRLMRRIDSKRSQRKKLELTDIRQPAIDMSAVRIMEPSLSRDDALEAQPGHRHLDILEDFHDPVSLLPQRQDQQLTFETFKESAQLSCHAEIGEAFKKKSVQDIPFPVEHRNDECLEFGPCVNKEDLSDGIRLLSPINKRSGVCSSSASFASQRLTQLDQCYTLHEQTISDVQVTHFEQAEPRVRSSYSRTSLPSLSNSKRILPHQQDNRHILPDVNLQHKFAKTMSHKLSGDDSMDSLLQFGEDLVAMLESRPAEEDSNHLLTPVGEVQRLDIDEKESIEIASEKESIDPQNKSSKAKGDGIPTKWNDNNKDTITQRDDKLGASQVVSEIDLRSADFAWSLEDGSRILTVKKSNRGTVCGVEDQTSEFQLGDDSEIKTAVPADCITLKIPLMAESTNKEKIELQMLNNEIFRPVFVDADTNDALPVKRNLSDTGKKQGCKYDTKSVRSETTSASRTVSQTSENSSSKRKTSCSALVHRQQPCEDDPQDTVTEAKNNNNGHTSSLNKLRILERDNEEVTFVIDDEKYEKGTHDWSAVRSSVNLDYVVGMARQDHLHPQSSTDSKSDISCCSPVRVKSIVHHLEEQMKKKEEKNFGVRSNSGSQTISWHTQHDSANVLSSHNFFNENPQSTDAVKTWIKETKDQLRLEVSNVVQETVSPNGAREPPVVCGSHACKDKEDASNKLENGGSSSLGDFSMRDGSLLSPLSDIVIDSISEESRSASSDTHSIYSDIADEHSSGTVSFGCVDSIDSQNVGLEEGKESEVVGDKTVLGVFDNQTDNTSTAICMVDEVETELRFRSVMNFQLTTQTSPGVPFVMNSSEDLVHDKGITDVTPPYPLVEVSSSSVELNPTLEQDRGKACNKNKPNNIHPLLSSYTDKEIPEARGISLKIANPVFGTRSLTKRESILCPASKPPSPVKKTVSFKLDITPTPSTSQSTYSDDAAICESIPPPPGAIQEPIGKPVSEDLSSASLTDQSTFTEEYPAVSGTRSASPARTVLTSSISPEDLSWWGAEHVEELEYFEEPVKGESSPGNKVTSLTSASHTSKSVSISMSEKEHNKGCRMTLPPDAETRSGPTEALPAENSLVWPKHSQHTLTENHTEPKRNETNVSTQANGRSEDASTLDQETYQKDNVSEKSDTWPELSESNSKLHTYSIKVGSQVVSEALINKDKLDDDIDGLVVDIDASSTLSDLVDQVDSSAKSTSLQSTIGLKTHQSDINLMRECCKPEVASTRNIPFWEKQNPQRVKNFKRKRLTHEKLTPKTVVKQTMSLVSSKQQSVGGVALNDRPITKGREVKLKRRNFKYRLVKSTMKKTKQLADDTNQREGTNESDALREVKGNSNSRDKVKQPPGKVTLLTTKTKPTRQAPSVPDSPCYLHLSKPKCDKNYDKNITSIQPSPESSICVPDCKNKIERSKKQPPKTDLAGKKRIGQRAEQSEKICAAKADLLQMLTPKISGKRDISCDEREVNEEASESHRRRCFLESQPKHSNRKISDRRRERSFEKKVGLDLSQPKESPVSKQNLKEDDKDHNSFEVRQAPSPKPQISCRFEDVFLSGSTSEQSFDDEVTQHCKGSLSTRQRLKNDSFEFSRTNSSGSCDDLTYRVFSSHEDRQRKSREWNSIESCQRMNSQNYLQRPHAQSCPYGHQFQHHRQADAHGTARDLRTDQHQPQPRASYATLVKPSSPEASVADLDVPSSPPECGRPGEWLFIASFFMFQILLHWLHTVNK